MNIHKVIDISEVYKGDDGLYYSESGVPLTTSHISVRRENVITKEDSKLNYIIDIFEGSHVIMHKVFSDLNIEKMLKAIPFYIFNANTIKDRRIILQKIIGEEVNSTPITDVYEYTSGYNLIDDNNLIYLSNSTLYGKMAHKTTISTTNDVIVPYTPNSKITCEFKFVEKFLSKPIYTALFVAVMSSYISPYLKLLNVNQKICVVVISETAFGKTSYASLLTRHHNTKMECSFFEDRKDFFNILASYRDCPVLVEELNKTASDSVRRKNEKLFSEMIQKYESNNSFLLDGQHLQFSATPIVLGEYMILNPSTINRSLIIEFTEKFVPEELSWLQSHQEYYDVFLDKFIDWICRSYGKYKDKIPNWKFKNLKVECEESYSGSLHRSQSIYKILNMTIKVLMDFFRETYNLPQGQLKNLRSIMEVGIDECMYSTIERLKKEDSQCGEWYTNVILDYLFYNYKRVVAENYEEYQRAQKKRKLFFESGGYICISAEDITKCFNDHKNNKYAVTMKAILSQLSESGLIHSTQRNNTQFVYIDGKRLNTRFVKIIKTEFVERASERQRDVYLNPHPSIDFWEYIYS